MGVFLCLTQPYTLKRVKQYHTETQVDGRKAQQM